MTTMLGPYVLPPDVAVVAVADLDADLRGRIPHDRGDFCVSRPRTRTVSSIVDGRTARLLNRFREPTTIVDAVLGFSAAEGEEPADVLDGAFGILGGFVRDGLLLPADSVLASPVTSSWGPGDLIGENGHLEVLAAVHLVSDTEVFLARAGDGTPAAVKIARGLVGAHTRAGFAREEAILTHLAGRGAPRLLDRGAVDGRPYVVTSWEAGVDALAAATTARAIGGAAGADELLGLAEQVLAAYERLHGLNVRHGDVHPRNVLVGPGGAVTLVDFAMATGPRDRPGSIGRGGIDFYCEPEYAAARLAGAPPPAVTAAGEQYSVAALVYLLLTGAHTHAFSLEPEQMLRQLVEEDPAPFSRHGAQLPAAEAVLARALAKDPAERYGSTAEFLDAFRAAAAADRRDGAPARPGRTSTGARQRLLDTVLDRLAVPGELFTAGLPAPTASVMNGAAGIGYALLRIAQLRGDQHLLATADLWSNRALGELTEPTGVYAPERGLGPELFGSTSLFHHTAGVHCVRALVARSRGDDGELGRAVDAFVATGREARAQVDLAFGLSGLLLGCAQLVELTGPTPRAAAIRALGTELADGLRARMSGTTLASLGMAHGWAGALYALLRWSQAVGGAPAPELAERVAWLGGLGRPEGRGLSWPLEVGRPALPALVASWCNGAAGLVHLWTLAYRAWDDETYRTLAERAAWTALESSPDATGTLCCGLAGRAYALLSVHRATGDARWLARAHLLADRAAAAPRVPPEARDSLYHGEVGVALLAAELAEPRDAELPLFGGAG